MTAWAARRFWKAAEVRPEASGWAVHLDARPVRTPAKRPLVMPTAAMAEAVALEWDAQGDVIDPMSMPVTRAVNAAIDKVASQRAEVVEALTAYGETDLLCYRAERPDALTALQAEAWDPMLDWAAREFGARLVPVAGVMPQPQDVRALARLKRQVAALDDFDLTAFHDLVMLSGSLVLGLAVHRGHLTAGDAWRLSRIDEEWQAEQWGRDEEAEEAAAIRLEAFSAAARFATLNR